MKKTLISLTFICMSIIMANSAVAGNEEITLLMGGDISWSLNIRPATVIFNEENAADLDWRAIPHLNFDQHRTQAQTKKLIDYDLHFSSISEMVAYPFKNILPLLQSADMVFLNLETPLSDSAAMMGLSRTPTQFAQTLHDKNVSVVSIANNHSYDADEAGFFDTMKSLRDANVAFIGGGNNLEHARKPVIFERHGIKIGFLGYAQFSNKGEPAFAYENRPGIAPMDPLLMQEDIKKLQPLVDYVVVSIHWGTDKSANVSVNNRKFAHDLIDAGADMIFGHHTPFAKGIETYKNKVIIYSPSHVFIGHNYAEWGDNYFVRFHLTKHTINKVEIIPLAGTGQELAQPFVLQGERASKLLQTVQERSALLDTKIEIINDVGLIKIIK